MAPRAAVKSRPRPALDRTPICSLSGILLHLNDTLAVLTRCAPTMPEDTNGEKDEENEQDEEGAKRVHQRGREAAQGPFQGPDPRRTSFETDEAVRRFSETEGARIGYWLGSSAVGIAVA